MKYINVNTMENQKCVFSFAVSMFSVCKSISMTFVMMTRSMKCANFLGLDMRCAMRRARDHKSAPGGGTILRHASVSSVLARRMACCQRRCAGVAKVSLSCDAILLKLSTSAVTSKFNQKKLPIATVTTK